MYALAEIFREEGKKVIVTTSTHLQTPPEEIRAWNIEEVRSLWKSDQIAVIGTDCESNKNLAAGDQAAVNQMENKKSVKKMRMPDSSFLQEVIIMVYKTSGVCSSAISFEIDNEGKVRDVKFQGGCSGNTQGVAALVEGMDAAEAVKRLEGIRCGFRPTSCPDQLAKALKGALNA